MALIAFLMDVEEGHIIPSFGLATALKKNGHRVLYISVPDNEQIVSAQGFDFHPVFADVYPPGFNNAYKQQRTGTEYHDHEQKEYFLGIVNGSLDEVFHLYNPDLLIVSAFLNLEALLLHYKYNIHPVIFTPFLRHKGSTSTEDCLHHIMKLQADTICGITDYLQATGVRFSYLPALMKPLQKFTELVVCPAALEPDALLTGVNVHFIEPSIRREDRFTDVRDLHNATPGQKIIYASLGSQGITYGNACADFFRLMILVMQRPEMQHIHLILAVGREFNTNTLGSIPGNITIQPWVPQTVIMNIVSLVITHGGLGTIKESICAGVPMIVFPIRNDQPHNARIIAHHRLGASLDLGAVTEARLADTILEVLHSENIRDNIAAMQRVFRQAEKEQPGVALIESMLSDPMYKRSFSRFKSHS